MEGEHSPLFVQIYRNQGMFLFLNIFRYNYVKHFKLLYNYHSAIASLAVSTDQSLASEAADVRVSLAPAQSPEAAASLIALPLSVKNYLAWLSFYNCWNLPSL